MSRAGSQTQATPEDDLAYANSPKQLFEKKPIHFHGKECGDMSFPPLRINFMKDSLAVVVKLCRPSAHVDPCATRRGSKNASTSSSLAYPRRPLQLQIKTRAGKNRASATQEDRAWAADTGEHHPRATYMLISHT